MDFLMAMDAPQLKVGAHVLVQLGSELVTDVEQAILECVKNAYDADSPGCLIDIDTKEIDTRTEQGTAARLRRFDRSSESVAVTVCDLEGQPLKKSAVVADNKIIQRNLNYTGRITIEDHGEGLIPNLINCDSLTISKSVLL
jgi:hypothetical protein